MTDGGVIWITGLSGAGKTTIAELVRDQMAAAGENVILLDGDALRRVFDGRFGFEEEDRRYLAGCYGRLCAELSSQGVMVVCATISMYHTVRSWNRQNIPGYFEVYLEVSSQSRLDRDPKGLYASGQEMVGEGPDFEAPLNPDLVIRNESPVTPDQAAARILEAVGC